MFLLQEDKTSRLTGYSTNWVLLVNKSAPPPANTTPISVLFPFNNLTPMASTSAGISTTISSTTPGATTPAGNGGTGVDSLYNQAQTELKKASSRKRRRPLNSCGLCRRRRGTINTRMSRRCFSGLIWTEAIS
ncbi:MAG: hypothetical protein J0I20_30205 [Chloroflexi bacterium]|nr:hypothetical protein [Chloroflexota bacterium]